MTTTHSALPGGCAELSRRPGSLLPDAHPAADPTGEVQSLLDDLAPACDTEHCSSAAVWIAWCVCGCGDDVGDVILLCSVDYADVLAGLVGWGGVEHGGHTIIVVRSERIRSKPTT